MSKRSRIFIIRVIIEIRTFSLNLGTSNKKFQATKYSLKRPFEKEYEYIYKKNVFQNISEKHPVLTLIYIMDITFNQ